MSTQPDSRRQLLERMEAEREVLRDYRHQHPTSVQPDNHIPLAYAVGTAVAAVAAWRFRFVRAGLGMILPIIYRQRVRPWLHSRITSATQLSKENHTMSTIYPGNDRELDRDIDRSIDRDLDDAKLAGKQTARNLRSTGRQVQHDIKHNFSNLLTDLQTTLSSNESGVDIETLRTRLNAQIERARNGLDDAAGKASGMMHDAVYSAEDCIRAKPLQTVGTVAGVAFVLGLLMGRR